MKGAKTGGRKKGTPNKRTEELLAALIANGYDPKADNPIVYMMQVYKGQITMPIAITIGTGADAQVKMVDAPLEPQLRVACVKEVAQYLYPKRKAIEVSTPPGESLTINVKTIT